MRLLSKTVCVLAALLISGTVAGAGAPLQVAPAAGATVPNGSRSQSVEHTWEFQWKPVLRATDYELWVMHDRAKFPAIHETLKDTRYRRTAKGYVAFPTGWKWKVRAKVGGQWGPWSGEREFVVAPPVT